MWLADREDLLPRLLGLAGTAVAVADLPPSEQAFWRAFSPATKVWCRQDGVPGYWRHGALVASAPRSQFDVLCEAAGRAFRLEGPAACVALEGRRFHGQRGRSWTTHEGNLHLSAAFPAALPARDAGLALTMLPALSVVDALRTVTNGRLVPDIKWVNDLLLGGKKFAGVLTTTQSRNAVIDLVVTGIGVNVEIAPALVPTPFVPAATCVRDHAPAVTLAGTLRPVLDALALRYEALRRDGPHALFADYRARSLVLGRRVRVWPSEDADGGEPDGRGPAVRRGRVLAMAPDLSLTLDDGEGPVMRGRLALEEACAALGL